MMLNQASTEQTMVKRRYSVLKYICNEANVVKRKSFDNDDIPSIKTKSSLQRGWLERSMYVAMKAFWNGLKKS